MSLTNPARRRCALAIAVSAFASAPALADTYYVAPCGNDGWTGTDAFCLGPDGSKRTIQAAIDAATDGDEIHVSAGTYDGPVVLDGKAVRLLGLLGRELTTIDGNGVGPVVIAADNEGADTIIEGFTITGGHAFDGAGMVCFGTSPTIADCAFAGNLADNSGGGLYVLAGAPLITGCLFIHNVADQDGGGLVAFGGSPTIEKSTFSDNFADWQGGGLAALGGATVTLNACDFLGNQVEAHGGGISNSESTVTVTGGTFESNAARHGGAFYQQSGTSTFAGTTFASNSAITGGASAGGAAYVTMGDATFDTCTFTDNIGDLGGALSRFGEGEMHVSACNFSTNTALVSGGAIWVNLGDVIIEDSSFDGNTASERGGHLLGAFHAQIDVRDCTFVNGFAADRGGAVSLSDPGARIAITRSWFGSNSTANQTEGGGGAISHRSGTLLVSRSLFGGNHAANNGGAILSEGGTATIVTSGISNNSAATGGAVYAGDADNVTVAGCRVSHNEAEGGGAFYDQNGDDTRIVNCTVIANTANIGSALLGGGDTRVANSIVRDNGALAIVGFGAPVILYSNIEGGAAGLGNIDVDPGFIDPAAGDYHLAAGSACIDAGVNQAVPADTPDLDDDGNFVERLPRDLDNQPRFADAAEGDTGCGGAAIVDMGAYETAGAPAGDVLIGDVNDDGAVDFNDLILILSAWGPCDGCCPADLDFDGLVDFGDLLILLTHWSD